MPDHPPKLGTSALKDWVDLRDQYYEPTLSTLRSTLSLDRKLLKRADAGSITGVQGYQPIFGVRSQLRTGDGRCTGYAIAALIDLQTRLQIPEEQATTGIVSADMLYWMGAYHERAIHSEEPSQGYQSSGEDELSKRTRTQRRDGLRSLRSIVKGFYHYGVCFDSPNSECPVPKGSWQSLCYKANNGNHLDKSESQFPDIEQSKKAKETCLGAYFRLRPVLNHFHAALNEVGAIFVSAQVHEGWNAPFDKQAIGKIDDKPHAIAGLHAVVIVGYNKHGFLVLNSWGQKWGGYKANNETGIAGVALWSYEDWSRNIVDAWVLRLGVSAPGAFSSSIGEQGWKKLLNEPIRSVPCHELLGHYLHLDDGFHVRRGPYPSLPENWFKTRAHLEETLGKGYRGVLIWIPGSLESIEDAFEAATRIKDMAKTRDLYPYVLFWCSTFVDKSMELLTTIFDSCSKQAGVGSLEMNALIEEQLQGVGRAIWRDIELSAVRAVSGIHSRPHHDSNISVPDGHVTCLINDMLEMQMTTGTELHMVAEGAGALIVQEILRHQSRSTTKQGFELSNHLHTLSLSIPAIGIPRARKHLIPLVKTMNARESDLCACSVPSYSAPERKQTLDASHTQRHIAPARIYVPSAELENRLSFGAYSGSLLQLVSRAFEDRWLDQDIEITSLVNPEDPANPPRTFLGMARALEEIEHDKNSRALPDHRFTHLRNSWSEIHSLSGPSLSMERVPQVALFRDPSIIAEIFRSIDHYGKPRVTSTAEKHDLDTNKNSSSAIEMT